MQFKKFISILILTLLTTTHVHAQSFKDVPTTHPNFKAIEYLKQENIISGYPDGTFKPDNIVNRAEALKIILGSKKIETPQITKSSFKDVSPNDWFAPFIEAGKNKKIISGNPDGTFAPSRTVNKVEFLKMLLNTFEIVFKNYQPPTTPLYSDTPNNKEWFIQYLDFAKKVNIITPDAQNNIYPSKGLTRGEIAEITYKLLQILKGGPTQLLLSRAESNMLQAIFDLQNNNIFQAELNITNAKQLAKDALSQKPDEPIVKGANKIIESFEQLILAFKEAKNNNKDQAIKHAGNSFNLAEEAKNLHQSLEQLSSQLKPIAQNLANTLRNSQ